MKKGWQRKHVGDLCEVVAGQSPDGKFYNTDGNGTPFYQGKKDFGEKFIKEPTSWTTQNNQDSPKGRHPNVCSCSCRASELCYRRSLYWTRLGGHP